MVSVSRPIRGSSGREPCLFKTPKPNRIQLEVAYFLWWDAGFCEKERGGGGACNNRNKKSGGKQVENDQLDQTWRGGNGESRDKIRFTVNLLWKRPNLASADTLQGFWITHLRGIHLELSNMYILIIMRTCYSRCTPSLQRKKIARHHKTRKSPVSRQVSLDQGLVFPQNRPRPCATRTHPDRPTGFAPLRGFFFVRDFQYPRRVSLLISSRRTNPLSTRTDRRYEIVRPDRQTK